MLGELIFVLIYVLDKNIFIYLWVLWDGEIFIFVEF